MEKLRKRDENDALEEAKQQSLNLAAESIANVPIAIYGIIELHLWNYEDNAADFPKPKKCSQSTSLSNYHFNDREQSIDDFIHRITSINKINSFHAHLESSANTIWQ